MQTETQSTSIVIGLVRFSYANVWEAKAMKGSETKKYSTSLLIPKDDKKSLEKIRLAMEAAIELGKTKFGKSWDPKKPKFHKPLRDGDIDRPEDEAYENQMFLNASNTKQPGILDRYKALIPADKQDEFYSGCYGHASITLYPFDTNGNMGVACSLNHVMKVKDGEAFSGVVSAEKAFADVEVEVSADDDMLY